MQATGPSHVRRATCDVLKCACYGPITRRLPQRLERRPRQLSSRSFRLQAEVFPVRRGEPRRMPARMNAVSRRDRDGHTGGSRIRSAGAARVVRGYQPRCAVGADRASLRGAVESFLETARRVAARAGAAHVSGGRATGRVRIRDHEPGCETESGNRRLEAGRIHCRLEGRRREDSRSSAASRGAGRGHALPGHPPADRNRRGQPDIQAAEELEADSARPPARLDPRRAGVRPAQSERPQRKFLYAEMLAAFKALRRWLERSSTSA